MKATGNHLSHLIPGGAVANGPMFGQRTLHHYHHHQWLGTIESVNITQAATFPILHVL